MATIALYANKINQMPDLIKDIKQSVTDYKSELTALKTKTLSINKSVCDLDDIISAIQTSSQTQEKKVTALNTFNQKNKEFITDVAHIDSDVADVIKKRKDDFYDKYSYLKTECEKNWLEYVGDWFTAAGEWCKEHWKEIVITIVIVIGAILAIAAVVLTGGMALAPLLAAGLTALGVSAGTALTIASVISLTIAVIAVTSTAISSIMNIADTWFNIDNPTFKAWKTAMNWTSMISNGLYSIGSIYNGIKGISNSSLRDYSKAWRSEAGFRNAIAGADNFKFTLNPNSSTFWTGMKDNGGEHVVKNYIERYGGSSLETILSEQGFLRPLTNEAWREASASLAMRSLGQVKTLVGSSPWAGSVWNTTEKILLNINPNVTGIKEIFGVISQFTPKVFQPGPILSGLGSIGESLLNLFNTFK